MITVQLGKALMPSTCSCCGQAIESSYGFLYRDGAAFGVYRAAWSYAHIEHGAEIAIDVAESWAKAHRVRRVAFGVRVASGRDDIGITLIDGQDSAWGEDKEGSRMLARVEALRHPLKTQVLDAAARLLHEDPQVRQFLRQRPHPPRCE